ncbi:MAG: NAD-dependent epimerase/dehydratase family protein [Erysipelotrichaceae bacterium]
MTNVSIIGANSYIGRNLIRVLLKNSDNILYLYDCADNQIDNFDNYFKIDVFSEESLKKINYNVDMIFMFTGKTGNDAFSNYNMFIDVNEKSLIGFLNVYKSKRTKAKIIFPSTRLVYKGSRNLLKETAPGDFKSIYSINKFACEKYLELYHNVFDIQYCICRISIPYGTLINQASSYGTIDIFMEKAREHSDIVLYGDGSPRRTITHIEDLCNQLYLVGLNDNCKNDVYNIGGEDYSLFEMAEYIAVKYKVGIAYIDWPYISKKTESGDTVFDSSKLDNIINYTYLHNYKEWVGIKQDK